MSIIDPADMGTLFCSWLDVLTSGLSLFTGERDHGPLVRH